MSSITPASAEPHVFKDEHDYGKETALNTIQNTGQNSRKRGRPFSESEEASHPAKRTNRVSFLHVQLVRAVISVLLHKLIWKRFYSLNPTNF